MRVAVVGAGWAGLAAAVRAVQAGHRVTLLEAAPMPGGRARSDHGGDDARDNGQHLLLGGYARTLALMRDVGVDPAAAFLRRPLELAWPDGARLAFPRRGPASLAAARALLAARGFSGADKLGAARLLARWRTRAVADGATVADLLRDAPPRIAGRLLAPLAEAALNTPVAQASGRVFVDVLRATLFGARGAADLLVPRRPLAQLLPLPALAWLGAHGAAVHLRTRATALERTAASWQVVAGDLACEVDAVVLAASATESARIAAPHAPDWAATARALAHEPIATVWLDLPVAAWPVPMLALDDGPAQFAFRAAAGAPAAFVVSAAGAALADGAEALADAVGRQAAMAFGLDPAAVRRLDLRVDRRATFRCTPTAARPPVAIGPGLLAAGDHVAGPWPATLEGAVLSGEGAIAALDGVRS